MKTVIVYDGSIHAGIAVDDLQWAGLPPNSQAIVLSVVEEGIRAPRGYGMIEKFANERVDVAEQWAEEACIADALFSGTGTSGWRRGWAVPPQ